MPNGSPNFHKEELPLLEAFFAKISPVLNSFALDHNLHVEKYYHEGPSWSFQFKNQKGGIGQIEVGKKDDDKITLLNCWWIDDYDTSTRFLKYPSGKELGLDHHELYQALENALTEILQWDKSELVPNKVPRPWSKSCSKKQFYKQYEDIPDLK